MPEREGRSRRRHQVAASLAELHGGVVRRADLLQEGLSRSDIRSELDRGAWRPVGVHTICVHGQEPEGDGQLWWALWESGPRSVIDGPSALVAAGLQHWREDLVHVTVPRNASVRALQGVRHHQLRDIGPAITVGLRRTKPVVAVIRAAQWARTDRAAATIVAMTVQQRLAPAGAVLDRWKACRYSTRRTLLDAVIRDVCDGAHSINELDVGAACRRRGLPGPTRQAVRMGRNGRVYLDLSWDEAKVHVEVQGAHHSWGTRGIEDAARLNDVALRDPHLISLQIPVLGWRVQPEVFLDQLEAALEVGHRRRSA